MVNGIVKAVLFDVGGTLLSEDGYDLRAAVHAALSMAPIRDHALRPETWMEELGGWVEGIQRDGHTDEALIAWVRERLRPEAHALLDERLLEDSMWRAGVRMSAIPGAEEALEAVHASSSRIAAISNSIFSSFRMSAALEEAGLNPRFEFLLSSADLGFAKPDPRIFELALHKLGLSPEQTRYVGDSWRNDVAGAGESGIYPIWVSDSEAPDDRPHTRLASVGDLPALMDRE